MISMVAVGVIEGQIATASGVLEWLQAKAERARKAYAISPLLLFATYLLGSVISNVKKGGVDQFDPEHAGFAADNVLEVSQKIRTLIALSEQAGFYGQFPASIWFRKMEQQGKELDKLAEALRLVDEKWQVSVSKAARAKIDRSRLAADLAPEEPIEVVEQKDDSLESPSEEAIRSHLHRSILPH